MSRLFAPGTFLIPEHMNLCQWSVIACDQYTSQPQYWQKCREITVGSPTALNCILPEAFLEETDASAITSIHQMMTAYLESGLFSAFENAYIYIERHLQSGVTRKGILGCIDLEGYEFSDHTSAPIRATEKTVPERIPPRMAVRDGAPLEFSHVLMLCDDEKKQIIEQVDTSSLRKLYDFDLMLNGGHLTGWLISGDEKEKLEERLKAYEESHGRLPYAIGDGNHSLASAKVLYEQHGKPQNLRYAAVELNNIHDDAYSFEPIHRLVKADPDALSAFLKAHESSDGTPVECVIGNRKQTIYLPVEQHGYVLKVLQDLLDAFIAQSPGEIDYIHGRDNLMNLTDDTHSAFILPALTKDSFFRHLDKYGVYCRKAFSIGEADDKRFYLESRRLY